MIKDAAVGGLSRAARAGRQSDLGVANSLYANKTKWPERGDCTPKAHLVKFEQGQKLEPRVVRGGGGEWQGGWAGSRACPALPGRAALAAHLTLDRRPVFRSGLSALSSQTPWLAFPSLSLVLSFFSLPPHPSPRETASNQVYQRCFN